MASSTAADTPSIEEILATKLSLTSVKTQGVNRTSPELLSRILNPVLSTGGTFQGVIEDVSQAVDLLRSTNCFKGVDAYVDRTLTNDASANFTLSEKGVYQVSTGSAIETGGEREVSIETNVALRNVFGKLDTVRAAASWLGTAGIPSFGGEPSAAYEVEYVRPFVPFLHTTVFSSFAAVVKNFSEVSSYRLRSKSGDVGIRTPAGVFSLVGGWREIGVDETASAIIREEAGHSWRTCLKYVAEIDGRDDPAMPSDGSSGYMMAELPLPVGNSRGIKVETAGQAHVPVAGGVLSVSGRSGIACCADGARVGIADRFFLGGSNSFRGFENRGVGPRAGQDALGGDVFYNLTGMFSLPLPRDSLLAQVFNARMHVFGSVGDLTEVTAVREGVKGLRGKAMKEGMRLGLDGICESMRVSVGVGVALQTSVGRIEINFCSARRRASGDAVKAGVQFGISESFS